TFFELLRSGSVTAPARSNPSVAAHANAARSKRRFGFMRTTPKWPQMVSRALRNPAPGRIGILPHQDRLYCCRRGGPDASTFPWTGPIRFRRNFFIQYTRTGPAGTHHVEANRLFLG